MPLVNVIVLMITSFCHDVPLIMLFVIAVKCKRLYVVECKRLEILGLDALQTKQIKSDLVLCYSIVHGHSCMKPTTFLFYGNYVILVLLEDNCLSLGVILMCGSIVLFTGLSISGIACRVILLMLIAFLYLNKNYNLLTLPPLCK